ncbi:hypothetical protein QRU50_001245 [Vibrio cholerae]|nr:hypothetical protein [Vibrio cholerae]
MRPYPFDESLFQRTVYAPYFDGLTQFISLSQPLVLSGDFDVSIVAFGLKNESYQCLFSDDTIDSFYRTLSSGAGIQCYIGNGVISWTTTGFDSSKVHKYSVRRTGNITEILIDDAVVTSRTGLSNAFEITRLMRAWTTSAFSQGVVFDFKVYSLGKLVCHFPFHDKGSAIQRSTVGTLTAEIINHTPAMWRPL